MVHMRRLFLLVFLAPLCSWAEIRYSLTPDPGAKSIRIAIQVEDPGKLPAFRIPAWCPGFYFLLKYQDKISDIRATDPEGKPLTVSHPDPRVWKVANPSGGAVTLTYSVLGDDPGLGFFGVNVVPHTAFVNGPAAFMYLEGSKGETTRLTIKNPAGWDVATAMSKDTDGTYTAGEYDELVDHPIQLGKFIRRRFDVGGIPYEAIFVSKNQQYSPDLDEEVLKLQALSLVPVKLFGGAAFKRYLYFLHLDVGNFEGGLEHRASTVIATPNSKPLGIETLAAHENFHAWNVKQIRPAVLGPFDYTQPVRTGNLWFSEGVTDYYAYLDTYRSGMFDREWLLDQLAGQIRELQSSGNRLKFTAEECSKRAWENGGFGLGDLSYYTKGLVMGLVLDAAIRRTTDNLKTLDDVMRYMYSRYRLPKPGFEEDDLRKAINDVSGKDLTSLYDVLARSTKEIPYDLLQGIGLRVAPPGVPIRELGYRLEGATVRRVEQSLAEAGLKNGDEILEIDGKPFDQELVTSLKGPYRVKLKREGDEIELSLSVLSKRNDQWVLGEDPFASKAAIESRERYLSR